MPRITVCRGDVDPGQRATLDYQYTDCEISPRVYPNPNPTSGPRSARGYGTRASGRARGLAQRASDKFAML